MARTAEGAALTAQHRQRQLVLRSAVMRDLLTLWQAVEVTDLAGTFEQFALAAVLLIRDRHRISAGLAAQYFDAFRRAEGIGGAVTMRRADPPNEATIRTRITAEGLAGILNARKSGFSVNAAARNGFVRASGSATRQVLDGGRDTLLASIREDGEAQGWQRVTSGSPCHFCAMIASRGAVFREDTADFQAHAHCSCEPEPQYDGSEPPGRNQEFEQLWADSTRGLSSADAQRAFRRAIEGRSLPDDPISQS